MVNFFQRINPFNRDSDEDENELDLGPPPIREGELDLGPPPIRLGQELDPGSFTSPFSSAGPQEDPLDQFFTSHPLWSELRLTQQELREAMADPSAEARTRVPELQNRVQDLTEQVQGLTGLTRREIGDLLQNADPNFAPSQVGNPRVEQVGQELGQGFVEGLARGTDEMEPSETIAQRSGRAAGEVTGTFLGALEPLLIPGAVVLNQFSNTAHLMEEFSVSVQEHGGLFAGDEWWKRAAVNAVAAPGSFFEALNYTFSTPLQRENLVTGERDERLGEANNYRGLAAFTSVNLRTGRETPWIDYLPNLEIEPLNIAIGPRAEQPVYGREVAEQLNLYERLGVDSELGKELVGLGIDMAADPWTWTDFLFAASKITRVGGTMLNSQQALRRANQLEEAGTQLLRSLAPRTYLDSAYDSSKGFLAGVLSADQSQALRDIGARPVYDVVTETLGKAVDRIMNIDIQVKSPTMRRIAGIDADDVVSVPLRYFFWQNGRVEFPGVENLPQIFTGGPAGEGAQNVARRAGAQFSRVSWETAENVRALIQAPVTEKGTAAIMGAKVNLRAVPKLKRGDEAFRGYVNAMDELANEFVDTVGIGVSAETLQEYAPRVQRLAELWDVNPNVAFQSFRLATEEIQRGVTRLGYELSDYSTFSRSMREAAEQLGIEDQGALFRARFEQESAGIDVDAFIFDQDVRPGMTEAQRAAWEARYGPDAPPRGAQRDQPPPWVQDVGDGRYVFSESMMEQARRMVSAARESWDSLTPDIQAWIEDIEEGLARYDSLSRGLEEQNWVRSSSDGFETWRRPDDVAPSVAGDVLDDLPGPARPGLEGEGLPELPWDEFTDYDRWRARTAHIFNSSAGNPFVHLNPESYLNGLRDGYLRRIYGSKLDPDAMLSALEQRDLLLFPPNMDKGNVVQRISSEFGEDAGTAVATYLDTKPDYGIVNSDSILELIRRNSDVELPTTSDGQRDFFTRIMSDDPYVEFLNDTVNMLKDEARVERIDVGFPDFGRTPSRFRARQDLTPEQRAALLQIPSASAAVSDLGAKGARAIRSQEFLKQVYEFLVDEDLIIRTEDMTLSSNLTTAQRQSLRREGVNEMLQFYDPKGRESYAVIPNNRNTWGPLAGRTVPRAVARNIMTLQWTSGATRQFALRQWMDTIRRGKLSPLSTTMRNVFGQFIIMHESGADLPELIAQIPEAYRAWREYRDFGASDGLYGMERALNFFDDASLSGSIRGNMEDALEAMARRDWLGPNPGEWQQNFQDFLDNNVFEQPLAGGFLRQFTAAEEITRVAAFQWARKRLLRKGLDEADALNRAAHFANNAANDYASAPLVVKMLRNTGLGWFPGFAYFQIGRTTRALFENPAALGKRERVIQGLERGFEPDEEERQATYERAAQWLRSQRKIILPFESPEGDRYVVGLDNMIPPGFNFGQSPFSDAASGGIYQPVIDAVVAFSNQGVAPLSAQYGRGEVFHLTDSPAQRLAKAASWVMDQYMPGQVSQALGSPLHTLTSAAFGETITLDDLGSSFSAAIRYQTHKNKDYIDEIGREIGVAYNLEWMQQAARGAGFSVRKVDPQPEGVDEIQQARGVVFRVNSIISDAQAQLRSLGREYDEFSPEMEREKERLKRLVLQRVAPLEREFPAFRDEIRDAVESAF